MQSGDKIVFPNNFFYLKGATCEWAQSHISAATFTDHSHIFESISVRGAGCHQSELAAEVIPEVEANHLIFKCAGSALLTISASLAANQSA